MTDEDAARVEAIRKEVEAVPLLHLHAQRMWHGRARIVGNRPGLLALRAALDQALLCGRSEALESASDGEGYRVVVEFADAAIASERWDREALPYADPIAAGDGA